MMASLTLLVLALAVLCRALLVSAATWTVGDSQGWTTGQNYSTWAAGKNFSTGDVLFFPYAAGAHDVDEVAKSGYDACSSANALATHSDGNTNITLNSTGTFYYLCAFPGHCTVGMKLAVTVVQQAGSANGSTPAPAPSPTNSSAAPTPAPLTTPAASSPGSATPPALLVPSPPSTTPPAVPTSPPGNDSPCGLHRPAAATFCFFLSAALLAI